MVMCVSAGSKNVPKHAKARVRSQTVFATDGEARLRRTADSTKMNLAGFTGVKRLMCDNRGIGLETTTLGIANDIVIVRKIGTRRLEGSDVLPFRLVTCKEVKMTRGNISNVASAAEHTFNNLNRFARCCFTGQATSEPAKEAERGTVKVVVQANTILLYMFQRIPRCCQLVKGWMVPVAWACDTTISQAIYETVESALA